MPYLALFFTLLLLFVNLWGGALLTGWWLRHRWLAFSAAPWAYVTVFFAAESVHGFGPHLWGLCVFTTLVSGCLIAASAGLLQAPGGGLERWNQRLIAWRNEFAPLRVWPCLVVLGVLFGYALAWRISFPLIDGSSEKIPDLAYISSYLPGEGIPAKDAWLFPYPSTQYYSFQYYAAALMGRMLALSPGVTYNLGFCTMVALIGVAFVGATTVVAKSKRVRAAMLIVFMVGGTGASGFVHLFWKEPTLWNGMRFIGSQTYDKAPIGILAQKYADGFKKIEVPGEPISYMIFLGDYHPPFSGFYNLALAVLAAGLWQRTRQKRYAFMVGATTTWMILSNTWTFPLEALAIAVWCLWHRASWRQLIPALALGCGVIWFLCLGYLAPFAAASAEYKTAFRWVPGDEHTPPLLFILYLLPTLAVSILAIYSRTMEGVWIGLTGFITIVFSEFVYVDDVYSGEYNRFNTTLKWWPWIAMAVLLLAAPIVIERARRKWVRWLGCLFCLYPAVYAIDLGHHWLRAPKPDFGKLEGSSFLQEDEGTRYLLARMKVEPRGVVLERPNKDSYTNSACFPLFAGHHLWLGWVGHEMLWHGYPGNIQQRQERLMRFFSGDVSDAPEWLVTEGIDYILWYQDADTNEIRDKIELAIRDRYAWTEVYVTTGGKKVGFWRRINVSK